MKEHVRVTAAVLVPLMALTSSCSAPRRTVVRLQNEGGETVVHVPESGGQLIAVPEAELWRSFRVAARELVVPADPLAFAEQTFELTEGSGTYWYDPRTRLLVPGALGLGLERRRALPSG